MYILTYFLLVSGVNLADTNQFLSVLSKFFKKIVRFIRVKYRKITMNNGFAQTLLIYIQWQTIQITCYWMRLLSVAIFLYFIMINPTIFLKSFTWKHQQKLICVREIYL